MIMKKIFFFVLLSALTGIVHAQQADKPPVRTSDPSPFLKHAAVAVPVSTSSAAPLRAKAGVVPISKSSAATPKTAAAQTQAAQIAPLRKADPAGNSKIVSTVAKGQQQGGQSEKTVDPKTLPPSATPVTPVSKQ